MTDALVPLLPESVQVKILLHTAQWSNGDLSALLRRPASNGSTGSSPVCAANRNTCEGGREVQVNSKGFVRCPKCGKQTKTKVLPETELKRFPLFCPWCKKETIIDK